MAAKSGLPIRKRDLWELALEDLDPADRESLRKLDKIDALKEAKAAAEKQRDLSKAKRWKIGRVVIRDVFEKILVWVDKFLKIVDIVVQFDPVHAALPWACIRLILQMAVSETQTYGTILQGLEHLSNLIGRCALVEVLYLNSHLQSFEALVKHLTELYAITLRYLVKAKRYFGKNMAAHILSSGDEFKSMLDDITIKEGGIQELAQMVMVENQYAMHRDLRDIWNGLREPIEWARDSIHGVIEHIEEEKREKLLDWISNVPFNQHHSNIRQDRLPDSGLWVLQKKQYKVWLEDSSCSILWLHGIPGSGKSKIVSLVIDTLRNGKAEVSRPLAFFYCAKNPSESQRGDAEEILRCILRQLSCPRSGQSILRPVKQKYDELMTSKENRKLTLDETRELILDVTEFYRSTTIVIDAVEECDPNTRFQLLDSLEDIAARSVNLVKILVTSRSHENIASEHWSTLCIRPSDNAEDIKKFIDHQVNTRMRRFLRGKDADKLKQQVVKTLAKGAGGMFQWVSLQLQNLSRAKMREDVLHELKQLPKGLEDTYSKIYEQIVALPVPSRSMAERVLKWLMCAQRRLSIEEFLGAVSVDSEASYNEVSLEELLELCCNFVVRDEALNVLRFAHFSVQEYLETRKEYSSSASHTLVAERCLSVFIPSAGKRRGPGAVASNEIFRDYATIYWAAHCYMSGQGRKNGPLEELFEKFIRQEFNAWAKSAVLSQKSLARDDPFKATFESMLGSPPDPFFAFCVWGFEDFIEKYGKSNKERMSAQNLRGYSGLHIASQYGQHGAVKLLLDFGTDVNMISRHKNTALHLAAEKGDEKIAKTLLESGASIHSRDLSGRTALHLAPSGGNEAVVELLLKNKEKVDVNETDGHGRTALHHAAGSGSEAIFSFLLEEKAEIEARDNWGLRALHEAAERGHESVVSLLLDRGAQINTKDNSGWTPLSRAVVRGHEAVVSLLLERSAGMKAREGKWGALHWAAEKGDEGMVQLLLKHDADVSEGDGQGKTPLHRAADSGHEIIAMQLLQEGAKVSARDREGKSPLHFAAERGHDRAVQLLMEHSVDVDGKDKHGMLALHYAAARGHASVVSLLVKEGGDGEVDNDGKTALHWAAERGHENVIAVLLEHSRKHIDRQDYFRMTACYSAAKGGHTEAVKLLLSYKADSSIVDWDDMTAFDWALQENHLEIAALLDVPK